MTKGTKTVLLIALACIAVSVVLFSAAVFLGGADLREGIETDIFGVNVHMGKDGFFAGSSELESTGYETTAEFTEKIDAIAVNWTSGEIRFEFGGENITVRESSSGIIDDENVMVCDVINGTLNIHYHSPRVNFVSFGEENKNLTVTIPTHLVPEIKNISIDATSADVKLGGFALDDLKISSTSGCADISDVSAGTFLFDATSGDLTLENSSFGGLRASSTSGSIMLKDVESGAAYFDIISGDASAVNCTFGKVEGESTSGCFYMSLDSVPGELDVDTTSGNVEIFLPEDAEFTLEFDRTSGDLELDFAAVMRGDEYIVGGGRNEINIETTSGNASVRVK